MWKALFLNLHGSKFELHKISILRGTDVNHYFSCGESIPTFEATFCVAL